MGVSWKLYALPSCLERTRQVLQTPVLCGKPGLFSYFTSCPVCPHVFWLRFLTKKCHLAKRWLLHYKSLFGKFFNLGYQETLYCWASMTPYNLTYLCPGEMEGPTYRHMTWSWSSINMERGYICGFSTGCWKFQVASGEFVSPYRKNNWPDSWCWFWCCCWCPLEESCQIRRDKQTQMTEIKKDSGGLAWDQQRLISRR